MEKQSPDNKELLTELNTKKLWIHMRQHATIWVTRLEKPTKLKTLTGTEDYLSGALVYKTKQGDHFSITEENLAKDFKPTKDISNGWQKFLPHPLSEGIFAAKVPHKFVLYKSNGDHLQGNPGDYVCKHYSNSSVDYPEDVWLIPKVKFTQIYHRVLDKRTLDAAKTYIKYMQ
eukprot:TRINITY_DN7191_c0_g1_i1.p1 TRINITY_DN7191_c0_g1~~TRINITY_DN7191_c0_g1_i1.p1  ORF type:complete len:173 (+),score=28.41 TRINITY_DN7191_c0_g1_i1:93-611(+)